MTQRIVDIAKVPAIELVLQPFEQLYTLRRPSDMLLSARAETIFGMRRDTRFRQEAKPISMFVVNLRRAPTDFGGKSATTLIVYEATRKQKGGQTYE